MVSFLSVDFFFFSVLHCDLSEAVVKGFSRRLLCVLHVNVHAVTSVRVEMFQGFLKD